MELNGSLKLSYFNAVLLLIALSILILGGVGIALLSATLTIKHRRRFRDFIKIKNCGAETIKAGRLRLTDIALDVEWDGAKFKLAPSRDS